jgi:hypothetical protein
VLLLATAVGAPFLSRLAQIARANVPFRGLVSMLVVMPVAAELGKRSRPRPRPRRPTST